MIPLMTVLIRFRIGLIVYAVDIKHMFLEVKVDVSHRDFLRFLWWPEGKINEPAKEYCINFGAVSSPSGVNFALQGLVKGNPSFSENSRGVILGNFYVDDILASGDDEKRLIQGALDVKQLCKLGGFHLTKFKSTSNKLLPQEDEVKENLRIDLQEKDCKISSEKTVGICWMLDTDRFGIEKSFREKPMTRRGVVSTI